MSIMNGGSMNKKGAWLGEKGLETGQQSIFAVQKLGRLKRTAEIYLGVLCASWAELGKEELLNYWRVSENL